MGKRKRVPEVLWRMYRNKARTLSDTLISLIPQHCDCNGRAKCLRCVFGVSDDAATSYLIRPDDPLGYRLLMTKCFVVLRSQAPPLPPLLSFSLRWSQPQMIKLYSEQTVDELQISTSLIVERTIQAFFSKKAAASDVICSGYKKLKMLSSIAKILTSSIWDLACTRIGDSLMDFLLMHAIIFVPIRLNGLQQVTGPPVNLQFLRFPIHTPKPGSFISMHSSGLIHSAHQWKRKRTYVNERNHGVPSQNTPGLLISFDLLHSTNEHCVGTHNLEVTNLLHLSGKAELSRNPGLCKMPVSKEQCSEELEVDRKKRVRLPSWQRRKRCKMLGLQDINTQEPRSKVINDKGDLYSIHRHDQDDEQHDGLVSTSNKQMDSHSGHALEFKQLLPLLCPCCLVLQSISPLPKDVQIKRISMFYSMEHSPSLFLKNHIIYSLNSDLGGATELLCDILGLSSTEDITKITSCFHNHGFCSHVGCCLFHSLIKLLKVFLHRAKHCQHLTLLKKHCPALPSARFNDDESMLQRSNLEAELASSKQDANPGGNQTVNGLLKNESRGCRINSEVTQQQCGLLRPYCLKYEVVSYVWAVCRCIIPPELLGEPSVQRILRRNVSRFVNLRRYEKFFLKQCVHGLDPSKYPLLSNKHFTIKITLLDRWIFWLFAHIVVPLIQANFYVTESEHGKQNLYYYRKSVWKELSDKVTLQLKGHIYHPFCASSVRTLLSKRSFGFSKVRLCPKETGVRPIANLRAPSRLVIGKSSHFQFPRKKNKGWQQKGTRKVSHFKAVNTVLRDLHAVFKDLRTKEPEHWGSSVSSYSDVFKKLRPFVRNLKKKQAFMPSVSIVVADVRKAFDTVSQDKLLSIINELQMADNYTLQKSHEVFCKKSFMWVSENLKLPTQITHGRFAEITAAVHPRSGHTILVNQDNSRTVKTNELKFILEEHLKWNILKLGKRFFRQILGIPQGSVLSSLLCSLYYGHMERNIIFPFLANVASGTSNQAGESHAFQSAGHRASISCPKYLLLRFVDDFLLLSTSKKQAASFFSRLQRGFREYNCYMNPEKFSTNFDTCGISWLDSKRILVGNDGASFICWSGLLINSCTLEIQADYTRYLNNHLRSTLTVHWEDGVYRRLKAKLYAYMRPKCHPIFFDASLNSPGTIRLNVYQAFVLCAMKFHCYIRELSNVCYCDPRSSSTSIEGSIRHMYKLMKRRMYGISRNSGYPRKLQVAKEEVKFLGLTAYVRVLRRKQSRHKTLLRMLRTALLPLSRVGSSELDYAIDDSHSSVLWKIKY